MNKVRRLSMQLLAGLLLPAFLSACALADDYRWTGVQRIVAISDPHGAYDAMVKTLANAGVLDESLGWSGEDAHLVITGDLMDRGPDSRRIMDLVMRLEEEAPVTGGMVHLTLGNHEVMNLVGDLRYVSRAEYAAFANEESAEEREKWFQHYRAANALAGGTSSDEEALRAAFDKARPPGIYAHRQAFGSEGKYGRWLLQKPFVVVVNDTAFVHGGLPPMIAGKTLAQVNDELHSQLGTYIRQLELLQGADLVDPASNFYDHAEIAGQLAAVPELPESLRAATQAIVELGNAPVHDSNGPLWYRGTVSCSVLSEGDVLDDALEALGAERLVIGHTPTVSHEVLQRFDGRVIEIDTGMLNSYYRGSGHALLIEGETVSVINENDSNRVLPKSHPRRVGSRDAGLSIDALEQLLSSGEISASGADRPGRRIVELADGQHTVQAVFTEGPRRRAANTELAAYRLDRLLKLDMVPATVLREIDGRSGTLQFQPGNTRTEADRAASGRGGGARCPLPQQWNSMYVFDALIGNDGRAPANMVYDPADWQLLSVGHQDSFGTRNERPAYLAAVTLDLSDAWIEALRSLSDDVLSREFSDVLDKRRIAALARRRDGLLSEARTD